MSYQKNEKKLLQVSALPWDIKIFKIMTILIELMYFITMNNYSYYKTVKFLKCNISLTVSDFLSLTI